MSFVETVTLVEALRKHGVHVEQLVFSRPAAFVLLYANRLPALQAAADFL